MRLVGSAITLAVLILGFAAIAQQSGNSDRGQPGSVPPAPAASSSSAAQVDESALRYFAAQGDTRRVNAEIARLRALYPNWTPPADLSMLSSNQPVADPIIERLWNLYKEDRIAEVRAAIAERQASTPGWTPPQELLTALETSEARRRLVNASDNGQWRTVLSVATETPGLLTCMNVDVLWRVAEAFAKTEQPDRARDAYTYVLTNCANPGERLATLQKALNLLPEQQVADLIRFERKGGETPDDFGPIRDELARRRVERVSTDGKVMASAEDLAVVERLAENANEPDNALLLGWYSYHRNSPEKAIAFFKTALARNGGAKAAEGYAMALRELNRLIEAEAVAYEWRDKAPEAMKVYLDVTTAILSQDPPPRLSAQVINRIIPVVVSQRSADGAQALGWFSYNTGQPRAAAEWFRKALSWRSDDEPSAYGLALASQKLNDRAGFNAITALWRGRSARIARLLSGADAARASVLARSRVEAAPANEPVLARPQSPSQTEAPRRLTEQPRLREDIEVRYSQAEAPSRARRSCIVTRNPSLLSADAAVTLGWCLMEMNRPLEAVAAFDQAIGRGEGRVREEAAYGKSLAYLRKGMTAEASVAAAAAPQTRQRQVELSAAILSQRAVAAYRDGRYTETLLALGERARIVPEQNDLMLIRGWSYFKLGRYADAETIFRAVHRTGYSDEASVGLNAVLEATHQVRQ